MALSLPEAIERHRAAHLARVEAIHAHGLQKAAGRDAIGPLLKVIDEAEHEAWASCTAVMPATMAELSVLAQHLRSVVSFDDADEPGQKTKEAFEALHSAAVALAFRVAHPDAFR